MRRKLSRWCAVASLRWCAGMLVRPFASTPVCLSACTMVRGLAGTSYEGMLVRWDTSPSVRKCASTLVRGIQSRVPCLRRYVLLSLAVVLKRALNSKTQAVQ